MIQVSVVKFTYAEFSIVCFTYKPEGGATGSLEDINLFYRDGYIYRLHCKSPYRMGAVFLHCSSKTLSTVIH